MGLHSQEFYIVLASRTLPAPSQQPCLFVCTSLTTFSKQTSHISSHNLRRHLATSPPLQTYHHTTFPPSRMLGGTPASTVPSHYMSTHHTPRHIAFHFHLATRLSGCMSRLVKMCDPAHTPAQQRTSTTGTMQAHKRV